MSKTASTLGLLLACFHYACSAAPTWPASTDELEDLMFLNSGHRSKGFARPISPCSNEFGPGRITAAAWLRTAFHDAISGNVFFNTGGLDGSIQYEINSGENNGLSIPTAVGMWAPYFSNQTSFADIVAAAVYSSVKSCGGPVVPVRGGRKDATSAGPIGSVPQPQNSIGIFRNQFAGIGMDQTAMIKLVACGHTLGSVHTPDTLQVIDPGTFPNDSAPLDSSPSTFDTKVATEYISGTTKDPLVVGRSIASRRNSDFVVFNSDGNATISALRDAQTFSSTCQSLFQQMIEVVPSGTVLSDVVTPYDIKPYDVQLTLLAGGTAIRFAGEIRVRTTQIKNIAAVELVYKDRTGIAVSNPVNAFPVGAASGFDDTFSFFGFSANLPANRSISSFDVRIIAAGGSSQTFNNNGNSFAVQDSIIYQAPQSCSSGNGKLTVVAAVRKDLPAPQLQAVAKVPKPSPNPVPSLSTTTVPMSTQSAVGAYQLYSVDYTAPSSVDSVVFGVYGGGSSDTNKNGSNLSASCQPLDTSPSTPSPSGSVFWGCYSDSFDPRALSSLVLEDGGMTVGNCASACSSSGYSFYGIEYGSQCWCGNSLDGSSTIQSLSDCNMPCAGDSNQICGAALRLSLYGPSPPRQPVPGPPSSTVSFSSTRSPSATFNSTSTLIPTSTSTPTPTPTSTPSLDGYDYVGCLSDAVENRTLSDQWQGTTTNNYSTCATFCKGYEYFGVEYSSECFCGLRLKYTIPQPLTSCSYPCSGSPSTFCGGPSLITVFRSQTPPSTAPINPPITGYSYKGCYVDSVNNRTLGDYYSFDSAMTVGKCAAQCTRFKFFGTEYGGECYCGDEIRGGLGVGEEDDCSYLCGGDEGELCGGANRVGVYEREGVE